MPVVVRGYGASIIGTGGLIGPKNQTITYCSSYEILVCVLSILLATSIPGLCSGIRRSSIRIVVTIVAYSFTNNLVYSVPRCRVILRCITLSLFSNRDSFDLARSDFLANFS